MTKRPLLAVAICFLFGLIFSLRECFWTIIPAAVPGVFIFLKLKKYDMTSRGFVLSGLLLVSFVLGIVRGDLEMKLQRQTNNLKDYQTVLVQGRLYKKEAKSQKSFLYLDKGRILIDGSSLSCGNILVVTDNIEYMLGNTLVVKGKNRSFERARNEGNYDEKSVYLSQGIYIKIESVEAVSEYGKENTLRETLYTLRENMKGVMNLNLSEENAGVLSSVVLGDKTSLSIEDKESYAKAGLSHVLSVSGLHVSLLCLGLYKLLRKIRIRAVIAMPIVSGFSVLYCIFSGAGVSTVRAVGMFNLSMIALVFGESYDLVCSLSLLAVIIATLSPEIIFSAGFLLSFSAVIGIAVTGQGFVQYYEGISRRRDFIRKRRREIQRKKERLLVKKLRVYMESFEKMLLINVGIILTTLPFVSWFYYEVPTLSLVVNILVIPLMGVLLGMGFAGSFIGSFLIPLGIMIKPCGYICDFYRLIARLTDSVPFSKIVVGRPSVFGSILYYIFLGAVLYYLSHKPRHLNNTEVSGLIAIDSDVKIYKIQNKIFIGGLIIMAVILTSFLYAVNVKKPCIKMLDVGQGDGIYLRTKNRKDVFIDGGSSSIKKVGKYRIEPFLKYSGIGTIDYWFVSHTDEDHIGGLIEIIESGYKVNNILFSKYISEDENYLTIHELCKDKGINIIYLGVNDELICGSERFICIYPNDRGETTNDNSLVLLYEADAFDFLLTGDIGKEQEKKIMKAWDAKGENKTHILKVAHHGSKNSSDEDFVRLFKPDIALISAGINNSYGHPHKETVNTLKGVDAIIRRTDVEGEIIINRE